MTRHGILRQDRTAFEGGPMLATGESAPAIELPDADPPKSITKEDLLKDEWI